MYDFNEKTNENRLFGMPSEYKFNINGQSDNLEEAVNERKKREISEGMEKYMPIGSVITIKNYNKLIMIIGFNHSNTTQTYDYIGCVYPFGINSENSTILFNHEQIERVYHIGFINNQERLFKSELDLNSPNNKGLSK